MENTLLLEWKSTLEKQFNQSTTTIIIILNQSINIITMEEWLDG
jgi:hypothetical protein